MIPRTGLLLATLALSGCPRPPPAAHCPPAAKGPPAAKAEATPGGSSATDFTLRDVEGNSVRLSDFEGKVVMLDFWATWCIPCEAELPHLDQLYTKYKERGLVLLAISMDGPETIASVAPFVQRNRLRFPVLLDEETRVVSVYNPKRVAPLTVLIDRTGRIAKVRQGYSAGDEKHLEEDIVALLGK